MGQSTAFEFDDLPPPQPIGGVTIIQAMEDKDLFKPFFRDESSWSNWKVFFKAVFGLPLESDREWEVYKIATGRTKGPDELEEPSEVWVIVGRRGGKSLMTSMLGSYIGGFYDYSPYLVPGEDPIIPVIANDREQATIIIRYVMAFYSEVKYLRAKMAQPRAQEVELKNGLRITVRTCNYRTVRGWTVPTGILEECAFWRSEGYNPDHEIVDAIDPMMATIPGAKLFGISSPHSRRGILYEKFKLHHGRDDPDVLVWKLPSQTPEGDTHLVMNPSLSPKRVAKAYLKNPFKARAEYGAEFRDDVEGFLTDDVIKAVVADGMKGRPARKDIRYGAFCDPSGGSQDEMTLSIGHLRKGEEGQKIPVQDHLDGVMPPFSPDVVVKRFAKTLKKYRVRKVFGDRYAAEWVAEAFKKQGIKYISADLTKTKIYEEAEPLFTTGEVEILDDGLTRAQLIMLESSSTGAGRRKISHPPKYHDDRANVTCGNLVYLVRKGPSAGAGNIW